jgi:hypothetical protein
MNAAIPDRRPATEELSGVIERVTFHNDYSGFCVFGKETWAAGGLNWVIAGAWVAGGLGQAAVS